MKRLAVLCLVVVTALITGMVYSSGRAEKPQAPAGPPSVSPPDAGGRKSGGPDNPAAERRAPESLDELLQAFTQQTGARLVFDPKDLPPGEYHDVMGVLTEEAKVRAATIALRETRKLPPGYLGKIGLKAIGIFEYCVSHKGDGFRPYDEKLKGYRYYGIWNGKNAVAGAYYSDQQLPLTLQHEIFHHVDGTEKGKTDYAAHFSSDDARFQEAVSGKEPYPAAKINAEDLAALKKLGRGVVLEEAVSSYAAKSAGEDQAETARHMLTALPDALVQIATRPQLAGSQRMLHILREYERAAPEDGPAVDWFVDVALGRARPTPMAAEATPKKAAAADLVTLLRSYVAAVDPNDDGIANRAGQARQALQQAETLVGTAVARPEAEPLVEAAAQATHQLLRNRIRPRARDQAFTIWGKEDASGVNWTLRNDLTTFAGDALRLKKIADLAPDRGEVVAEAQLKNLRLVARYFVFLASQWEVSSGTKLAFEKAKTSMVTALPAAQAGLAKNLSALDFPQLAEAITAEGRFEAPKAPAPRAPEARPARRENAYLKKVDSAIEDAKVRAAIRDVQPACVRVSTGGSGVNLAADGRVLTCAHVAGKLGAKMKVTFPDGQTYAATCTHFDRNLDLASLSLTDAEDLPFASVAKDSPEKGTAVVCIGQPGDNTPGGQPTGYKPFHVSTGHIRGFLPDLLGPQTLGKAKHDAWTYWGHSGSPLFNQAGRVVALHNSWDSTTAMRHAVPHEAIVHFLDREKIGYRAAE